jgi:hypothetical protein
VTTQTTQTEETTMTTTTTTRIATIGMTVCYWTATDRSVNTGRLVGLAGNAATIQIHHNSAETIERALVDITSMTDEPLTA